jgi:hypothetical protein
MISRRTFLAATGIALVSNRVAAAPLSDRITHGREFLAGLFDAELGLLPEFRGAKTYWLSHDNYLAAKVLEKSHPKLSSTIMETIKREGLGQSDGKTEMLFGESRTILPFRQYDLSVVRKVGDKTIRTEVATERLMKDWERYVDLLFLAAIAKGKDPAAKQHWDEAMKKWDGQGFSDPATSSQKSYSTYKLALAVISAKRLVRDAELPQALIDRLKSLQTDSGGWITNYESNGTPQGFANVETSCLAIIAFESLAKTPKPVAK